MRVGRRDRGIEEARPGGEPGHHRGVAAVAPERPAHRRPVGRARVRSAQCGPPGQRPGRDGVEDPLAGQRVDARGGVAGQQHPAVGVEAGRVGERQVVPAHRGRFRGQVREEPMQRVEVLPAGSAAALVEHAVPDVRTARSRAGTPTHTPGTVRARTRWSAHADRSRRGSSRGWRRPSRTAGPRARPADGGPSSWRRRRRRRRAPRSRRRARPGPAPPPTSGPDGGAAPPRGPAPRRPAPRRTPRAGSPGSAAGTPGRPSGRSGCADAAAAPVAPDRRRPGRPARRAGRTPPRRSRRRSTCPAGTSSRPAGRPGSPAVPAGPAAPRPFPPARRRRRRRHASFGTSPDDRREISRVDGSLDCSWTFMSDSARWGVPAPATRSAFSTAACQTS